MRVRVAALAVVVLMVGLAWWLRSAAHCGPGDAGRLWFSGDRTTIVAYCDEEGRYVRAAPPLPAPRPADTSMQFTLLPSAQTLSCYAATGLFSAPAQVPAGKFLLMPTGEVHVCDAEGHLMVFDPRHCRGERWVFHVTENRVVCIEGEVAVPEGGTGVESAPPATQGWADCTCGRAPVTGDGPLPYCNETSVCTRTAEGCWCEPVTPDKQSCNTGHTKIHFFL